MPAEFERRGVRFLYPENWTLDEGETEDGLLTVAVRSPGGAFWSLDVHPRPTDPEWLVEGALQVLREEYPGLDVARVAEHVDGYDIIGYDVNFIYLDLISTATIRSLRTEFGAYLILCQAEDRDFEKLGLVFSAITKSLLE